MVYPRHFIKMTVQGQLAGTDEIFNFGIHFGRSGEDITVADFVQIAGILPDVATLVQSWWTTIDNHIPNGWKMTSIKFALIAPNGKYDPSTEAIEYIYPAPVAGGYPDNTAPQLAAVITLESNKPRDPGKYNRFYVPTTAPQNPPYRIDSTTVNSLANTTARLLSDISDVIRNVIGGDFTQIAASASGTGYDLPAVRVRVGNVVDTQRRRRNKLPEAYTIVDVP